MVVLGLLFVMQFDVISHIFLLSLGLRLFFGFLLLDRILRSFPGDVESIASFWLLLLFLLLFVLFLGLLLFLLERPEIL